MKRSGIVMIALFAMLGFWANNNQCFANEVDKTISLKSSSDAVFENIHEARHDMSTLRYRPRPPRPPKRRPRPRPDPRPRPRPPGREHSTNDCRIVTFTPQDELTSRPITLVSDFYVEDCRYDGYDGRYQCYDRYVRSERRTVRVSIINRGEMFPWEADVFRVCLQGYYVNAYVVEASHDYDLDSRFQGSLIEAHALHKVASKPDPRGIRISSFDFDPQVKSFKLALTDRWAQYYAGEQTQITVSLRKSYSDPFYKEILKKKIMLPASDVYNIDFVKYVHEFKESLRDAKQYFVKVSFTRIGRISKDTQQNIGKTRKVKVRK
ncbi:hypothetical protein ACFL6Y_05235 [Elusimicrobiota bacterium]